MDPGPLGPRMLISTSTALVIPWCYLIYVAIAYRREMPSDELAVLAILLLVSLVVASGSAMLGIVLRGRK